MPIAIYSRKSKFTGKGESIENQIELCRQYIGLHYTDCGSGDILVYEDEGFSGGNTKRPHFLRMMEDAKNKKFTAVVCYRLDRISRNIGDFAKLIEELNSLNVSFVSIKEQFDTSSPMGRAMMYISSVFSQLERETIAERIRDNMHELAKTGRWLGGTTPTGYASEEIKAISLDGKTRRSCMLRIIDSEAGLVKLIFSKFLETNSFTQTETFLINNGYRTKRNKLFTRFALKNILRNPVYANADGNMFNYFKRNNAEIFAAESEFDGEHGIMAYNRTLQKTGHPNQVRPISEWIITVGRHKGIISGADWLRVQELIERNKDKNYHRPRNHTALLAGILRCGICGHNMHPKLTQRVNADDELVFTYRCGLKDRSKCQACNVNNVNGNTLDKAVCAEIRKLVGDNSEFVRQLNAGKTKISSGNDDNESELTRLREMLAENDKSIKALVDSLVRVSGTSAEQYVLRQIDNLHNDSEQVRQRIEEHESLTAKHELSDIEFDLIRDMLSLFANTFDEMGYEQKRAALRSLVKSVIWDGEAVHLYLFGSYMSENTRFAVSDILS